MRISLKHEKTHIELLLQELFTDKGNFTFNVQIYYIRIPITIYQEKEKHKFHCLSKRD